MNYKLILATSLIIGIIILLSPKIAVEGQIKRNTSITESSLLLIQNNTVKATVNPVYEKPINKLRERALQLDGQYGGQCVFFVQQFMEIFKDCSTIDCEAHPFRGYAGDIEPNSDIPKIGSAILFDRGHTAVIIDMYKDTLELIESNYRFDEIITVGRIVTTTDNNIKGYFYF